jgi:hypothetical protein
MPVLGDNYSQTHTLYLLAGMSAKLSIVFDSENNKGARPLGGSNGTYREKPLLNGFLVLDEEVGEIKSIKDEVAVLYTHKKAEKNTIVFYGADRNIKVAFQVMQVPIHDHSTIAQGGPAYGTYFNDTEED